MKKIKYILYTALLSLGTLMFVSCLDDLDRAPDDELNKTADQVYGAELLDYQMGLAKIYAGLAISGNAGEDGDSDVAGVDGGSQASFLRGLWNLQELPTDEAHCAWNDIGIPDFNNITWSADNVFIKGFYYRLAYQVGLSNQFLRETTEGQLSSRGMSDAVKAEVNILRADARFMRALAYYYMLDMFRNVPFLTEEHPVGTKGEQIKGAELFTYIETELKDIETTLLDPFVGYNGQNYGRVTKAAAWALLSRLYLNAEVYTGTAKYKECATYAEKVMLVGYELEPKYGDMFNVDNDRSKEMILPIRYMGAQTQTWGGMTFLICSTVPTALQESVNSVGAWQGNRARSSMLKTFEKESNHGSDDRKAMLKTDMTESNEINSVTTYLDNGIPIVKYYNRKKDGSLPPGGTNLVFVDFPLFRLAEIYLNYAEAVTFDPSSGDATKALDLVNKVRSRAYSDKTKAPITASQLTKDFILDERGREFFFEAQRRTDLIRHGKFTGGSYLWEWKGGSKTGQAVADHFQIYPIPTDDLSSNENLTQNPGYSSSSSEEAAN